MDTGKVVDLAKKLRDELLEQGASEEWVTRRKIFQAILKISTFQLNYEGMKQTNNEMYVKFFEGGTPLTSNDSKTLKEAAAIDKQMGKKLREIRLAKK